MSERKDPLFWFNNADSCSRPVDIADFPITTSTHTLQTIVVCLLMESSETEIRGLDENGTFSKKKGNPVKKKKSMTLIS